MVMIEAIDVEVGVQPLASFRPERVSVNGQSINVVPFPLTSSKSTGSAFTERSNHRMRSFNNRY